jgi:hypothetical protein
LQGAVLVSRREVLVVLHPLLDVARTWRGRGSGIRGRCGSNFGSGHALCGSGLGPGLGALCGAILAKAAGVHRRGGAQQDKCRAKTKPG